MYYRFWQSKNLLVILTFYVFNVWKKKIWTRRYSSAFFILDIHRWVIRRRIHDDFAPSIRNSLVAVRQGIDRFPEHDGVVPPRPCGLFRSPQPFLSFPRLSHVLLSRQRRRNLLFLLPLLLSCLFSSNSSSHLPSLYSFLLFFSLYPFMGQVPTWSPIYTVVNYIKI